MNPPKKLTTQHQAREEQQATVQQNTQAGNVREFATAEEMLRHDALHTPVPPSIAKRLKESIEAEGPLGTPWWRRLFGGKKP